MSAGVGRREGGRQGSAVPGAGEMGGVAGRIGTHRTASGCRRRRGWPGGDASQPGRARRRRQRPAWGRPAARGRGVRRDEGDLGVFRARLPPHLAARLVRHRLVGVRIVITVGVRPEVAGERALRRICERGRLVPREAGDGHAVAYSGCSRRLGCATVARRELRLEVDILAASAAERRRQRRGLRRCGTQRCGRLAGSDQLIGARRVVQSRSVNTCHLVWRPF